MATGARVRGATREAPNCLMRGAAEIGGLVDEFWWEEELMKKAESLAQRADDQDGRRN